MSTVSVTSEDTFRSHDFEQPALKFVIDRFEEMARAQPDAIALSCIPESEMEPGREISYAALNSMANRIAQRLRSHGCAAESIVGVVADSNVATIATVLGVLKCGACFLPLNLALPSARLESMVRDSGLAALVVTATAPAACSTCGAKLIAIDDCLQFAGWQPNLLRDLDGANAAYTIYTSGSTGQSKGVVITHEGLSNHCSGFCDLVDLTANDVVFQFANLAFDAAYEEIFPFLSVGARLVLRNREMGNDIDELLRAWQEQQITVFDLPTAFWRLFTKALRTDCHRLPESLRAVVIGGEEANSNDVQYWRERYRTQLRLLNSYGPTEATIISTACDLLEPGRADYEQVPLGNCLPGVSVDVQHAAGAHEPGEIYLSGAGLARGYLNDPGLTADRFVPRAGHYGEREYRTGDLALLAPAGDLVFKGRQDNQVKLNGYRIQLEEVEEVLRRHPGIASCAVVLQDNRVGGKRLIAYCILAEKSASLPFEGAPLNVSSLRAFLQERLPEYMHPAEFSFLEKFIYHSSGKIDRSKLPQIGHFDRTRRRLPDYVAPNAGLESRIAAIWCSVLDLDPSELSAEDPFEYIGGNSLYSIQIRYEAKRAGLLFKASDMHLRQTVRGLAKCCESSQGFGKRAKHALLDYQNWISGVTSVVINDAKRSLGSRLRPRDRHYRQVFRSFYNRLADQRDILYMFFTTNLLHWVRASLRFVPADVNVVLIGSGLAPEEIAWVRQRFDRPFLHLEEEISLDLIWDVLFAVNTRNFGWLDPDCFVMNRSLFAEMSSFSPYDAINCLWTHAACGPTKRPFHVIESYFLFFNIAVIEQLRRAGVMPRPADRRANLKQIRLLRKLIPSEDLRGDVYSGRNEVALAHRLFKFEFDRLILFQLIANSSGFKLNRVRFFTEIDTFNPYNYYSDEAVHVFPTIRHFDAHPWSGIDQKRRLTSDYLLLTAHLHDLPPMYQQRCRFLESKFPEMELRLEDIATLKGMIRRYLLDRGVTQKTLDRPEFEWLADEAMAAARVAV